MKSSAIAQSHDRLIRTHRESLTLATVGLLIFRSILKLVEGRGAWNGCAPSIISISGVPVCKASRRAGRRSFD